MKKLSVVLVLLVVAVACAAPQKVQVAPQIEEESETVFDEMEAPEEPVTGKLHQVDIENFAFSKKVISIKRGDSVVWVNKDGAPHTATSVDRSWDTGRLAKGESKTLRFDKTGTFEYFCEVHPSIKATVIVTP